MTRNQLQQKTAQVIPLSNEADDFQRLIEKETFTAPDVTFNDGNFSRAERMAKLMASGASTVPKHLRGNVADCFAIVLQTFAWGLNNPFAVASKTHMINEILCYEAQLVNAVIQSSGIISGHFLYEYKGEGSGLECRVGAVISGDSEITWGEWLSNNSVTTRNSPLWKTNPRQQLGYLQVKNWARSFYPGALLGVYTPDEMIDDVLLAYNPAKTVDLSTPEYEATFIIEQINSVESLEQLSLLKSKADLVKGDFRPAVRDAYKAKRKALAAAPVDNSTPAVEESPAAELATAYESLGSQPELETVEVNNVVIDASLNIVDAKTGEIVDQYTDLRLAISECVTISDLARILKAMPPQAKADLKAELTAQQTKINEAKK